MKFVDALRSPDQRTPLQGDIFEGLVKLKDEYVIRLQPGAQLLSINVPRCVPLFLHDVVRMGLGKLEADGVIRKVGDPTDWYSGIGIVPKSVGQEATASVWTSHA